MGRRPRTLTSLLLAAVLVAALAVAAGASVSGTETDSSPDVELPARVVAEISELGVPQIPNDWVTVEHVDDGRYVVTLSKGSGTVDVLAWDAVADVVVIPQGHGRTEVRFRADAGPVDTRFSVAAVLPG